MEIPIELFGLFIGTSVALAIFGFLRNPQIPAMLTFGGIFILFISVTTDNIIMDYFTQDDSTVIKHYNVPSNTGSFSIFDSSGDVIVAEYVSSSSSELLNDQINCVEFNVRKNNNPPISAPVLYGVWDTSANLKHEFGRFNVTALTTASTPIKLCDFDNPYTIVNGDAIGVQYLGGDATNSVRVNSDNTNPFDGTITYVRTFSTDTLTWTGFTSNDLQAVFSYEVLDTPETTNIIFEFTELPKVIFSLLGSIFMLSGALMVFKGER